jgi:indole-3-glycerol phosphate synthase/phosphoribosylanthranilate isomerase
MANVLEQIVVHKRQEVAQRKLDLPLADFIDKLVPTDRDFYGALAQANAGFIFECKKASPSKGLIRENFDLDEIIQAYSPYAACISVLTDEKYFQGKFEYLEYVRARVSQPVINKDFFVDPYQVHLARFFQADAILLMLSVLDDAQYIALAQLAQHYNMHVLTEVSNEQEVLRAVALKANIIGINNRDLRDLSTNLATTEQLVPLIKRLVEENGHYAHLVISESGIYSHQDVRRLAPLVDGFLVGSSLMSEPNISNAAQQLLFGTIKICGITDIAGARLVAESPAQFTGLIFAPKSKRVLSLKQAYEIITQVPADYVGVFVNGDIEQIVEHVQQLKLVAVQLHGQEDQDYINRLRGLLPASCELWLAKGVTASLPSISEDNIDYFLLDCQVGEQSGGTGQRFSWQLLDQAVGPSLDKTKLILAGGISADNIKEAAGQGLAILDLNSGVEVTPGIKDKDKIEKAFYQLREY